MTGSPRSRFSLMDYLAITAGVINLAVILVLLVSWLRS